MSPAGVGNAPVCVPVKMPSSITVEPQTSSHSVRSLTSGKPWIHLCVNRLISLRIFEVYVIARSPCDEAIQIAGTQELDCFALLAMTM